MKKIIIYSHAGSTNHGCEALLRTTVKFCPVTPIVFSISGDDYLYGADKICEYAKVKFFAPKSFQHYLLKILSIFDKNKYLYTKYWYKGFDKLNEDNQAKIAIAIGGDAYCYGNNSMLISQNKFFNKRGIKTILWGCSIEPNLLSNLDLVKDLNQYSIIIARESITKKALENAGVNSPVIYAPDPAFSLIKEEVKLDHDYTNTVGINLSPMIISHEISPGIIFDNYCYLINELIFKFGFNIALIPHVVSDGGSDLEPLMKLFEKFKSTGKIWVVDEDKHYNCMQIKYIISKCRFFIAARTHASIAAYSSLVPTLVVGYSVKALGIARDIFGDENKFVISSDKLNRESDLYASFKYIIDNEKNIKIELRDKMLAYSKYMNVYSDVLINLLKDEIN